MSVFQGQFSSAFFTRRPPKSMSGRGRNWDLPLALLHIDCGFKKIWGRLFIMKWFVYLFFSHRNGFVQKCTQSKGPGARPNKPKTISPPVPLAQPSKISILLFPFFDLFPPSNLFPKDNNKISFILVVASYSFQRSFLRCSLFEASPTEEV